MEYDNWRWFGDWEDYKANYGGHIVDGGLEIESYDDSYGGLFFNGGRESKEYSGCCKEERGVFFFPLSERERVINKLN